MSEDDDFASDPESLADSGYPSDEEMESDGDFGYDAGAEVFVSTKKVCQG